MNKAALWDHGSTKLNHEQEVSHNYLNTHINHKAAQRAQNCCMLPIAALVKITLTKYYHGKQSCSEFKCWTLWKQKWSSLVSVQLRSETHQDQIKAQVQYVVQSLKMVSYFSLLSHMFMGWYVNYLLQWFLLFLSLLHVIISISLLFQAEKMSPGIPFYMLFSRWVDPALKPTT